MISVIIPFRDKEVFRIDRLIESFDSDQISEFIIVDYGSKKHLKYKHPKVKIIRNESEVWNKAHALNIGIKKAKSEYIMTTDVDIILLDKLDIKLENAFYYSSNVERINKEDLKDYSKTFPWNNQVSYAWTMCGLANGGLQIYPKKFIEEWNGIDENLIYSGGMDNIVNLMAKKSGMKVIQLPNRLLHIEHEKKKSEQHKDVDFAEYVHSRRGIYLNEWILNPRKNEFWGRTKSNCVILKQLQLEYNGATRIPKDRKLLITVINNKNYLPQAFVTSLIQLYQYTKQYVPQVEMRFVKACAVNEMRNLSVQLAIEGNFDYLIQLDDDHIYEEDTIIKLISHDLDIVTVPTKQRVIPFNPTQYRKFKNPIRQKGNYIYTNKKDGLVQCSVSGPVAMLIKVDVLREMDYPYYYIDHNTGAPMGGDFVFCRQLKAKGFKIFIDSSIGCPHMVNSLISSFSKNSGLTFSNGSF